MAYKGGRLVGPDQSRIQRWGLGYHQYMDRRDSFDQFAEVKKLLHYILLGTNQKLYESVYPSVEVNDPDVIPGHSYGVEDLGDLENIIKKMGSMGTMTPSDIS